MDPDRVRAYLQAACAGLGFDIGEIWWTNIGDHHNGGTSTVAAIEEPPSDDDDDDHHSAASSSNEEVSVSGTASSTNLGHNNNKQPKKKLRFVQLYTSKSFASRRSQLVRPEDSDDGAREHVLSPRLVHAIANTAQVVWAHANNNSARSPGSGLTGRSDVTLHTAVGMPVAVDADGNMCVVVMFSPLVIENTAHAMDYLSSIARSATNSSIPCLLPVFDPQYSNMRPLLENNADNGSSGRRRSSLLTQHHTSVVPADALGEGVTARFVSFADTNEILGGGGGDDDYDNDETHDDHHTHHHSVTSAPKDTFGIPMLPGDDNDYDFGVDVFDEASYGIWNTIMDTLIEDSGVMNEEKDNGDDNNNNNNDPSAAGGSNQHDYNNGPGRSESQQRGAAEHSLTTPEAAWILQNSLPNPARLERLEEFFSAFLDMSVFDLADVWVPNTSDGTGIFLSHVLTTRCSSTNNASLEAFAAQNSGTTIAPWSGAVGRAYSSGNPVWSANRDIFVDETRDFGHDVIQTVLAVPVLTKHGTLLPRCVVACYSLVKSGSVPFVLRFVQQALQLLWDEKGLVENWNGVVAPADLGEMAADVEMQSHFMTKKRPHAALEDNSNKNNVSPDGDVDNDPVTADLSSLLQSVTLPNGDTITVPLQLDDDMMQAASAAAAVANHTTTPLLSVEQLQQHVYDAVRSVQNAVPFELQHASKRPHVEEQQHHHSATLGPIQNVTPLSMPAPLPTHIVQGGGGGGGGAQQQQQQQRRASQKAAAVPANMTFHQSGSPQSPQQQPMQQQQQQSVPQQTTFPWMSQQSPGSPQSVPASNQPRPQQQQQQQQQAFPLPVFSIGDQCFFIPNGDGDSMPIPDMATSGAFGQHSACRIQGCAELAHPRRPYCQKHAGNRLCEHVGCDKCAQGSTRFCIAHGGGRRCTFPGCDKGARDKFFCAAHGGGKRCRASGCTKSAVGGSTYCTAHGGGRRCAVDGCDKSAQSSTNFCVKHGGGKKCAHEGCEKVARGRTQFCAAHGGGVRCKLEGCNRVAIGKFQLCRTHGGGSGGGDGRGHVRNTSLSPASIEASNVSNNPFAGSPSTVSDNSAMAAMGMQQHVL